MRLKFASSCHTHWSTLEPVYEVIQKNPKFQVSSLCTECPSSIGQDGIDYYVVTSWMHGWYLFGEKGILIPHGVNEEEKGYKYPPHFKRILISGTHFSQNHPAERLVGFPKSDVLFGGGKEQMMKDSSKRYGLDTLPFKKTVLFNGGYTGEAVVWSKFLPELITLSKKLSFNVIIKLREEMGYQKTYNSQKLNDVKEDNLRFAFGCENNWTLFPFADVSISPFSSTAREFEATKKPAFIIVGMGKYSKNPQPQTYTLDIENLEKTILDAFDNPYKYTKSDGELETYFYKLDGHVVDRIIQELEAL